MFYLFLPFIFRVICGYVDDPEYLFVLKRLPHSAVKVSPRCGGVIISAVFCLMDEADRFNMAVSFKRASANRLVLSVASIITVPDNASDSAGSCRFQSFEE